MSISLRRRIVALRLLIVVAAALSVSHLLHGVADARQEEGFVARALGRPGVRWRVIETPNATLRALRGSAAEARVASLAPVVERARRDNLERLGVGHPEKLKLFFVGSRQEMKPFVGWTPGGMAVPGESAAIFVTNDSVRPALRHELMHVVSIRAWGPAKEPWLAEGLAMDAVGRCHGYPIDEMASALAADGKLVPLSELASRFQVRGDQGVVDYTHAASVVRYVATRYGREKLRALWTNGLATLHSTLGTDVASLDRDWRRHLAKVPHPTPWATILRDVKRNGCE